MVAEDPAVVAAVERAAGLAVAVGLVLRKVALPRVSAGVEGGGSVAPDDAEDDAAVPEQTPP